MNKLRVLLKAPMLTQSGYGVHSKQILQALLSDPLFDVFCENINWGICSFSVSDSQEFQTIKKLIHKRVEAHNNQENWDLAIMVTIPNEFQKLGKINIGVTAGIETDRISPTWINKINEVDLTIVPSEHSKNVIQNTFVQWKDNNTGNNGQMSVEKPVVVCNEGVDCKIFRKLKHEELNENVKKLDFESDFNFLHIGQWGAGSFGEDRKNISNLVKYFIETFKNRKDVGLVLKVNMAKNSMLDELNVKNRIELVKQGYKKEELPPIYLLHGYMTDEEMASLYNHHKIKAFISLTHGEGFGLPLLEAAACELPILVTGWSGHLDFLKNNKFIPLRFTLKEIPDAAVWNDILVKGSRWAEVDENDVKQRMEKIVKAPFKPKEWAKELSLDIKNNFDVGMTNQKFVNTIKKFILEKAMDKLDPIEYLKSLVDTPDNYNVIYTMPMSSGDVFISTAVINGLKKELPSDAKIYFATSPQYTKILEGNPDIHMVVPWHESMIN